MRTQLFTIAMLIAFTPVIGGLRATENKHLPSKIVHVVTILCPGPAKIEIINNTGIWTKSEGGYFGIDAPASLHVECNDTVLNITKNGSSVRIDIGVTSESNVISFKVDGTNNPQSISFSCNGADVKPDAQGIATITIPG